MIRLCSIANIWQNIELPIEQDVSARCNAKIFNHYWNNLKSPMAVFGINIRDAVLWELHEDEES